MLAQGKNKEAIVAYCWPLTEFPGEGHVMGAVEERLDSLGSKVPDKKELAELYNSMLGSIARNASNKSDGLTQVFATLSQKLVALYREMGRDKEADNMERSAAQWLASRPQTTTGLATN